MTSWTIGIVMVHDAQTYFEYTELEQAILNQVGNRNNNYHIFYFNQETRSVTIKKLSAHSDDTLKFKIEKVLLNVSFYDLEELKKFFSRLLEDEVTGTDYRYMIITWGHAAGLGYFISKEEEEKELIRLLEKDESESFMKERKKIRKGLRMYSFLKANLSLKADPDIIIGHLFPASIYKNSRDKIDAFLKEKLRVVSATQLNKALADTFIDRKVNILLNINCYTQMLETGYELKDTVKVMISPQTGIPFAGVNYNRLFEVLENNPEATEADICKNVTKHFHKKYNTNPFKDIFASRYPKFKLRQVSIACNDLGKYKEIPGTGKGLNKVISDVAIKLKEYLESEEMKTIVESARGLCEDPSIDDDHGIIDFTHFINCMIEKLKGNEKEVWKEYKRRLKAAKEECNLAFLKAHKSYYISPDENKRSISPHFISVFFPLETSNEIEDQLAEIYFKPGEFTVFRNDSEWDDFVDLLIKKPATPPSV